MDPRARKLLQWFRRNRRDLPWRRTSDPYAIWVSEVMLQQTRVETVVPYYDRFIARFPTVEALAAADEGDVVKKWEGLGYYSRARNLHRAARALVDRGSWPGTRDELLELPGFGPYTAGAVASLAFGEAVPAVDGNVRRVFSRLFAEPDPDRVPGLVEDIIPPRSARAFNEAVMELGALVCLPRNPRCEACPLRSDCEARAQDAVEAFPVKRARRAPRDVAAFAAWVERDGRVLLERRDRGLLAGTWGLPWVEGAPDELPARVAALTGGGARVVAEAPLAEVDWTFTHKRWRLAAVSVTAQGSSGTWAPVDALESYGFSAVQRALVAAVTSSR